MTVWKEVSREKCPRCDGTGVMDADAGAIGTIKRRCGCEAGWIVKRVEVCTHCQGTNSDCCWCRGTGIQREREDR